MKRHMYIGQIRQNRTFFAFFETQSRIVKVQKSDSLWCLVYEINVCYSFASFETLDKSHTPRAALHHESQHIFMVRKHNHFYINRKYRIFFSAWIKSSFNGVSHHSQMRKKPVRFLKII
jgi:hypothetical protein